MSQAEEVALVKSSRLSSRPRWCFPRRLAYIPFGHENVPTRQRVRSVAEQMKLDELGSVAAVALHLRCVLKICRAAATRIQRAARFARHVMLAFLGTFRKPGHTGIQHVRLNHSGSWELRITVVSASKAEGREAYTIDRLGYKSEKAAGLQRDAVMVYVGLDQYDPLHFPEEYKGKLLHQGEQEEQEGSTFRGKGRTAFERLLAVYLVLQLSSTRASSWRPAACWRRSSGWWMWTSWARPATSS